MKPTIVLVSAALVYSTVVVPPAAATGGGSLVDVSPVKVSIGRVQPTPGNLSYRAYVRGTDARVWYRVVTSAGAGSGPWRPFAGAVSTGPDVVPYANRQTHLLAARSLSGSLVMRDVHNGVATIWRDFGGALTSAPSLALHTDDSTIAVVARGTDGGVWFRMRRGGVWQRWLNLGGRLTSAPDVATLGLMTGFIVSGRGLDGQIWRRSITVWGGPASDWRPAFFSTTSSVSAWQSLIGGDPGGVGPQYVYRGADNALYFAVADVPEPERRLGGDLTSGPDRDNPGGSKRLNPASTGGERTNMVVARDADNALALYDLSTGTWTNLGGSLR